MRQGEGGVGRRGGKCGEGGENAEVVGMGGAVCVGRVGGRTATLPAIYRIYLPYIGLRVGGRTATFR